MTFVTDQNMPKPVPGAGQVFSLAWPMTLKAILLHGTVLIDAYLVSSLGEVALAALGIAAAVAGLVLGGIFAFSAAVQIRAAQATGTGDIVFRKSVLASGLSIGLGIGTFGLILIWMFARDLLSVLAPTPEVAALAWQYLSVFSLVILGEALGQTLASHFNGNGQTRIPLYSFCLSVPINVSTSIIFIHGLFGAPALGVVGAAIGSALAIWVQVAFLIGGLWLTDAALVLAKGWRNGTFPKTLRRHAVFALPIAATFFSANLAGNVSQMIYARMPLNAFAAMTLIAPWIMVVGQISMQWTQATGILVAQLLGQRTPETMLDRFVGMAWRGAFVTAVIGAVFFAIISLAANVIYDDLTSETHAVLYSFLPVLLILPFFKASNAICGNVLRASGDTVHVMKIFLTSQWGFRVPATALAVLVFNLSPVWVLALLLAEELVKFPMFHRRLWLGDWKRADVAA